MNSNSLRTPCLLCWQVVTDQSSTHLPIALNAPDRCPCPAHSLLCQCPPSQHGARLPHPHPSGAAEAGGKSGALLSWRARRDEMRARVGEHIFPRTRTLYLFRARALGTHSRGTACSGGDVTVKFRLGIGVSVVAARGGGRAGAGRGAGSGAGGGGA